jgi:ubiquinone/menaquinone biosynthesis C-methylase UbiE
MAEKAVAAEAHLWPRAGLAPGADVADVGCGPGAMLPSLAAAVTPGGTVTAVDADPRAVATARAAAEAAGLSSVRVLAGRAEATGLAPASFDVVMLRHVLAHNGGHEDEIVAHLAALVRPGGCVYLVDVDFMAMTMQVDDPDIDELQDRYRQLLGRRGNDARAGLRLAGRLVDAGLELVAAEFLPQTVLVPPGMRAPGWAARDTLLAEGLATPDDVERWERAFTRLDARTERPTLGAGWFAAIGRRQA